MSESGGQAGSLFPVTGLTTDIQASSGIIANGVATATLAGAAGKTTFITGFTVLGNSATAGSTVDVTVTGPTTTLHFPLVVPTGVGTTLEPLLIEFARPVPASAVNVALVVSCPALGAGSTACAVNAFGYQQ